MLADMPERLFFDGLLLIVGGGAVDIELLQRLHDEGASIVAADGGAHNCALAGIMPKAIIGDMDSLGDLAPWADKAQIFPIKEQQTTDFEKSLYMTHAPVTLALGMSGKRLDHTLAALEAVAQYGHDRHIILVDTADIALGIAGSFSFGVDRGDKVSVHPLQSVRFLRSEGLKYPLDGLNLAPGVRTGTSNQATADRFSMTVEEGEMGVWLLVLSKAYLDQLVAYLQGGGRAA